MGIMMEPRPYRDERDWQAMLSLLIEGRAAFNESAGQGTYYVHTGDVSWWLYYNDTSAPFSEQIALWADEAGRLLGWVLFTLKERFFDLFVHPILLGRPEAAEMHAWAESRITSLVKARGGQDIRTMWIAEGDQARRSFLEARGFRLADDDQHLHRMYVTRRSLAEPVTTLKLPEGFSVRGCRGEAELEARARAQYGAFQSSWDWDKYTARFRRFMRSPVYCPEQDVVAVAPDGRIAAFAIHWLDGEAQSASLKRTAQRFVGYFEPVGAHPDFQRQGLGRAVIAESLRRMQAAGMTHASVCCDAKDPAAVTFYQSCGFQITNTLLMYVKEI